MGELDGEILWLVELSHVFSGTQTNLEYIKSNSSNELQEFLEEENVTSASQLVRDWFRHVTPSVKVEFIAKRQLAKRAIERFIERLKDLNSPERRRVCGELSTRWMRFPDLMVSGVNRGQVVYLLQNSSNRIAFFRGLSLGHYIVDGRVVYYSVFMDNAVVERVHPDCIWTQKEMDAIAEDGKLTS